MTKVCTYCNLEKEIEHFYKKGDRYRTLCKSCTADRYKASTIGKSLKNVLKELHMHPPVDPIGTLSFVVLPEVPKQLPAINYYADQYPKHIAQVDYRHQEYIKCLKCSSQIVILRHTPRHSHLSKFSTYHPQASQQCQCKALAVLVDHRGNIRVYTDTPQAVSLISPLTNSGYPLLANNTLADYYTIPIANRLLDGPKPTRLSAATADEPIRPFGLWDLDTLDFGNMSIDGICKILPLPVPHTSNKRLLRIRLIAALEMYVVEFGLYLRSKYVNYNPPIPKSYPAYSITTLHFKSPLRIVNVVRHKDTFYSTLTLKKDMEYRRRIYIEFLQMHTYNPVLARSTFWHPTLYKPLTADYLLSKPFTLGLPPKRNPMSEKDRLRLKNGDYRTKR